MEQMLCDDVGRTALFRNKSTGETKEVSGLNDIGQAWNIASQMAEVWGWSMADVTISMA